MFLQLITRENNSFLLVGELELPFIALLLVIVAPHQVMSVRLVNPFTLGKLMLLFFF